jgi:UDP-glucose 4-epimerase
MMKILDCIDRGIQPQIYSDGSQTYDFIHVVDVARANVCALKSDCEFGCFNVGRGVKTSIKALAELLLKLTHREKLGLRFEPAGQTFVTKRIGCPRLAKEKIGFQWTIDLEEGMNSLIEWRRHHQAELVQRQEEAGCVKS